MALQPALLKAIIAYYSEFERESKDPERIGLCGVNLNHALGMDLKITIPELKDYQVNIKFAAKILRFFAGTLGNPDYWDLVREYGGPKTDVNKVARYYFYFAGQAGQPEFVTPLEAAKMVLS